MGKKIRWLRMQRELSQLLKEGMEKRKDGVHIPGSARPTSWAFMLSLSPVIDRGTIAGFSASHSASSAPYGLERIAVIESFIVKEHMCCVGTFVWCERS